MGKIKRCPVCRFVEPHECLKGNGFSRSGGNEHPDAEDIPTDADGRPGRGFAAMNPEKRREVASRGGRAAHQRGTAHEFTTAEAREAGRKGGLAQYANRKKAEAAE